ncbi:lipoprotein [Streptomyces sulfonofaciens]|uniref:Lipoprotein n=1 Tax=Streptomyces sulfonofaciens TaxID=68272 RepID=A0A919KTA6_9ACTN|nr:lipoprotein [Streptomyces sulfonofaciens]
MLTVSACDQGSSAAPGSSNASDTDPSSASSDSSQGSSTHTFDFSGKNLTVDSDGTGVEIVPGDVTGVRVQREIHGTGAEASWGLSGNTLTLRVKPKCHGNVSVCSAKHRITVGRDVTVTAESRTGAVTASHISTPLSISTSTGAAKVSDSSGPVNLSTRTGAVLGTGLTSKKVTAKARTGSVDLGFSAVPDDVEVDARQGTVDIGLPKGGATYAVDASSKVGTADIGVPSDSGSPHSVKAHTTVGSVSVHGN